MTYFDCKAVLETVKKLDGDSKTLFGQYTAPRVKVNVPNVTRLPYIWTLVGVGGDCARL